MADDGEAAGAAGFNDEDLDDYDDYDGYGGSTSRGGRLGAEGDRRERKMNRRPSSPGGLNDIISRINQRLDMLTQFEGGSERFDQYELVDSHSFDHGPHDPFRYDSYGYEDSRGFRPTGGSGNGGDFDNFDNMWQTRALDSGWGTEQRPPRSGRAPRGHDFGHGQDSWGGGGRSREQDKLPSLLAQRVYPTSGAFKLQHDFWDYPDRHCKGNRKRGQKKPRNKRKQSETAADEPSSKMGKTETEGGESDNADPEQMQETKESKTASERTTEGKSDELDLLKEKLLEKQDPPPDKSDNDAVDQAESKSERRDRDRSIERELNRLNMKYIGKEDSPEMKPKKRRGLFKMSGMKITARRIAFVCSVCKFRTFFREEMVAHMESKYHKDMFKFLSGRLTKRTTEFLEEYMKVKFKTMDKNLSKIEDHSAAVCQIYREQDCTSDIDLEHFIKKVEVARCAACDLCIPMQEHLIQNHLRSSDHNYNRKRMLEDCKKAGVFTARSILNHKPVQENLKRYLKGENPFTTESDDQDLEDSAVIDADLANDRQEEAESAGDSSLPTGEAQDNQVMQEVHEEHEEKLESGSTSQEDKSTFG